MNPKTFLLAVLTVLFTCAIASAQVEEITLSTYYPAPYGEYEEMAAENLFADKVIIGNMDVDGDGIDSTPADIAAMGVGSLLIENNLGIGTTAPGYKLDVNGHVGMRSYLTFDTDQSGGYGYIRNEKATDTNNVGTVFLMGPDNKHVGVFRRDGLHLYGNNISDVGSITTSGNVGIGITGPGARLHVRGDYPIAKFDSSSIYGANMLLFNDYDSANSHWRINAGGQDATNRRDKLNFTTANDAGSLTSYVMTLQQNGNVGIGTTTPQEKLHVAGNLKVDGNISGGGIDPDWDSGWVFYNRIGVWGWKTLNHNLNAFPRQIQWWFSPGNPGSWVGPVDWSKQDHWTNPIGVQITTTQMRFMIWHDRYIYRFYHHPSWYNYNSGYYRILLWK